MYTRSHNGKPSGPMDSSWCPPPPHLDCNSWTRVTVYDQKKEPQSRAPVTVEGIN